MNLIQLVFVFVMLSAGCGEESECDPATFKDECLDEVTLRHCAAKDEQAEFFRIEITDCSKSGAVCVQQVGSDESQCGQPRTE